MKTISQEEFRKLYGGQAMSGFNTATQETGFGKSPQQGLMSSLAGTAQQRISNLGDIAGSDAPLPKKIVTGLGQVAGGVFEAGIKTVASGVSAVIPDDVEREAKKSALALLQTPTGQKVLKAIQTGGEYYQDARATNPEAFQLIESVIDISSIYPIAKGVKTGIDVTKDLSKVGTQGIKNIIGSVKPVAENVVDVTKTAAGGISRIPSRVGTNIAEKQAVETTIKTLPTQIAQIAARDGIDPIDIKKLYSIPKEAKPKAKELSDTVRKFVKAETTTDPIEIVGKPIVERIKTLEKLRGAIGQKLGVVSGKLGIVNQNQMTKPVLDSLKNVRGLEGLTMDSNGVLNFKNTVLSSAETASDRKAIQSIFTNAIKGGTGKQKHLLRQELFEVLGGKKRAGIQLTDTQDKAYQAIRKGLSDVLESKNTEYKSLSNQYRAIMQPLTDMRKMMKSVPGVTEDILDMNAGLLARRLTSTSLSQGQVRTILNAMDNVTKIKGTTAKTTQALQDLYNILGKYYDIAPKTGFQGQVKAGVESASGIKELVTNAVRGVAGETTAVRQKALEEVLKEVLGL